MNKDMCVACDDGILNIRVGAIIMKDGKILMVGNDRDYLYSVGGRVKFGETAEEAVVREVLEETGVQMEIDRLGFVHEKMCIRDSTVSVAAPVAAMAPAKKMQKSLQSSNGLPKKRQRLTQVRYIKAVSYTHLWALRRKTACWCWRMAGQRCMSGTAHSSCIAIICAPLVPVRPRCCLLYTSRCA